MSNVHFEKLTPVKNADLKIYNDALDFVFENNDVKNIAITGAYSAGKSSVIESYKQKHKELKFIHISLANFITVDEESFKTGNNEGDFQSDNINNKKADKSSIIKESVLEGKVLNQLLHQIDKSKIPQTNFRTKQEVSNKRIWCITLIIMIFLLSILHIRFYNDWCLFVSDLSSIKLLSFLSATTKKVSLLFSSLITIVIIGLSTYKIIKTQKNKSIFKRLKVQGNEIEIFEKDDESYFDKYLNEVLYLFDNANVDCIVFEDMDRYNINQIFQRLREVNILVNGKRRDNNKKMLRFFYLLRDDVFVSKDRTKFFDFIMPVVPIIDSSNSFNQFIIHLKQGGIFERFDEHFLQGISLYVDDMRLLKNIYNEYIVYYNRIGTTEQDYNKLLAMIVYKNIFPRDFNDTQLNKGFISTLFSRKNEFVKNNVDRINKEIKGISDNIELCGKEYLKNINELNSTYKRVGYYNDTYIDTSNEEYINRKERIELIQNNGIESLKSKIKELENEKMILKNMPLQKIITRENIDFIFNINYNNFLGKENYFNEMKSSQYFDLIKYLIWNGKIDETYEDYMSYFYPNSLTNNDKMFLRSVTDKKAKAWDYKIDNPKLVLSRLKEEDFEEIETLNFHVFEYLLDMQSVNEKYLTRFIEQLKKDKLFMFMEGYFNVKKDEIVYVKTINRYWPSFLSEMFTRSEFSYNQKKDYILLTIYYCNSECIDMINKDDFLSKTISSDAVFLNIKLPKVEELVSEFSRLNIKFKSLDFEKSHKDLFNAVYENKLYEFTFENLSLMLKQIYNIKNQSDIHNKNYSLIRGDLTSKLYKYVNENIKQYMILIIDNCNGIITDNQEAVLELINNEDIEFRRKKDYVEYLQTQLDFLHDIQEIDLWDLFLQKGLIQYSENNILHYYFKSNRGLSDSLVNFINSNEKILRVSSDEIDSIFGEESASSLFDDIIVCKIIADDKYKNIIDELGYEYSNFSIEEVTDQKIIILIQLRVIKMTAENVRFMRIAYKQHFIYFIENNINEYIEEVIEDERLSYIELIYILQLDIDDGLKINLISNVSESIQVISKNYSDNVKQYILKHKFDRSELIPLVERYQNETYLIKKVLKELSIEYIEDIIESNIELSMDLFEFLISSVEISTENKIILLTAHMNRVSRLECENYMKIIGSKEHVKIFSGRPNLEINEINKKLLENIKSKHWISNFYEENGVFKIRRRNLKGI